MDKIKFEILKFIQDSRDNNISIWWEQLEKKDFNLGLVKYMIEEGLIHGQGCFALTLEGSKILREYLLIEATKKQIKKKVIFDSNIYDLIADGNLNINLLSNKKEVFEFYITHIQIDEINKCSDEDKRARLFLFMTKLSPIVIPTESGIWGISRWGESKCGGGEIAEKIKGKNVKNIEDSLIGEVSIKNGFILVTEDVKLKNKVNLLKGKAVNLNEFKEILK